MHHFVVNIHIAKYFKNYCQNISFSLIFLFFLTPTDGATRNYVKKSQTHKSGDSPLFFFLFLIWGFPIALSPFATLFAYIPPKLTIHYELSLGGSGGRALPPATHKVLGSNPNHWHICCLTIRCKVRMLSVTVPVRNVDKWTQMAKFRYAPRYDYKYESG